MRRLLFTFSALLVAICYAAHGQVWPGAGRLSGPVQKLPKAIHSAGPPAFTENKGQLTDQHGNPNMRVKYLLSMPGLNVQLRQTGFSYDTYIDQRDEKKQDRKFHRIDIELENANPAATITVSKPAGGVQNVVTGEGKFTDIRQYQTVTYHQIYPGIDLEFVANAGKDKPVEYNFIVHPGADASAIKLRYKGANKTALAGGKIMMELRHGKLSEQIPASWLAQSGKSVSVSYQSLEQGLYAFQVPAYDKSKTLVIDPTPNLEWATYYGGTGADLVYGVDSDPQGNIYVTGSTASTANIASAGAYQPTFAGGAYDIFVAKFNSSGERLWATYYGGSEEDQGYGVTYNNGLVYVGGRSKSTNLATAGAHQTTPGNQWAAILARFDAASGQLNWATYYGGPNRAGFIQAVRVDASGNIFAFGGSSVNVYPEKTNSTGTVATPGTYRQTGGSSTSFLVKFNSSGVRQWGTFVSGREVTTINNTSVGQMRLDASGDIYIGGGTADATYDANLPANVGEGTTVSTDKGFIAKFSSADGTRLWGRFYDGAVNDLWVNDAAGQIHVVGQTTSNTGIASTGAFRASKAAPTDGYWATFDMGGHYLRGTYLGASNGSTYATAVRMDGAGNLVILGCTDTNTGSLATNCTYQSTPAGLLDVFVNKFSGSTGQRIWGTYYGGPGNESLRGGGTFGNAPGPSTLSIMDGDKIVIGGSTDGGYVPTTEGSYQPVFAGAMEGFIAKFNSGELPASLAVTPTSLAPMTQTACILGIPSVITGNAVGVTAPSGYKTKLFYQWQQSSSASGPWSDISGEVYKDLQPMASQTTTYYRRLVRANADFCNQVTVDSSQVASVQINANAAPIANADGPQWYVCGPGSNTVTLNGSATGGTAGYTYQWFEGSTSNGTPLATTGSWISPAISEATTYTLQVTDAAGCKDIDQVTVVPAVANAGVDVNVCQGKGGVQIGSAPVASPSVSYTWSVVSGDPISTLSCTSCAQPVASPAVATIYRLTVTVQQKGGGTCVSTDDVGVYPIAAPIIPAFAGPDKTICKNTADVLGNAPESGFSYTWTPGQYLSASQVANPTFNAGTAAVTGGAINYTVTAIKDGCAFTDEVKVYSINNRITDQDELNCGPMWSYHLDEDNAPGAVYSWSVVSGDGVILQTARNGKDAYLKSNSGVTRFRRTVTLNGVSCTAELDVQPCTTGPACDFDIVTLSKQACPKVFGPQAALKLGTTLSAADYNFSWSPANLVDNAHAATVNITSTAQATITVTVTNKYDASITCQESIVINPPGWSLPVFTATDKSTCPNTTVQIGSTPNAGFTYQWTPSAGLSADNIANPTATVASTSVFYVSIKETASGCENQDTIRVNVLPAPVANAGRDRAVCNGATVTLGSPAPTGTNWNYSWEPSNAAWTNGTGPTDAQPQVQFAFATPQSYILTVTDPVTGCMDKDTVLLSNTVTSGEYAGTPKSTCQGVAIQLGYEAEPFAQYQWFMADGVTPATGLSCTTCANPTVTNPTVTTTYTVKVSYPGCSTPMTDQVTLTVTSVQGLELVDQTVCPAGPIAIGYGAAGNPAPPAGATFAWSPATGLNAVDVANPIATVTREITYTVTVTLPGGCTFTDQVKVSPSANAGSDAVLCPGESTEIGTPAIAGATYSWTGAGIVGPANIAQPTVKPSVTTTYQVSVTINGCTTTDQVVVTVNSPANFAITGNTAICEGGVATLSLVGTPPANTTWQWSPLTGVSNPTGTSTSIAAASTQTYRLTQTNVVTGCSNYKEVVVVVNPNTIAATTGDVALCDGASAPMPLNVTSSGNYSYVWSPSVGLSNAFIANPTVTTGTPRTYSVTVTDNASQCQLVKQVNVSIKAPEACFAPVTLTGNVFHDANALKDVTVNTTSANPIPTGLYVTLVDSTGAAVKTVPVNPDGTYDFGVTAPGDYSIVLHQTSTGSTVPSLPSGWVNTGENLGAGVGSDQAVSGILTGVTVAGTNVTNANFGVQQPPVTTDKTLPSSPNPGGTTTVDISGDFNFTDTDGTVQSITFTQFPENVTTVTINGITYVAPGTTPGAGQQVFPGSGVTVPATNLEVLVDPVDGNPVVKVPFFVTDNGGLESNVSTVTKPFTTPAVHLSGNVFHDANALTDNTVNTTSPIAIPSGLYATLVDASGKAVATVPVKADGTYDFGNVNPGTYSVVLHQTPAGSTTPSLPAGWVNTGEHLGANAGSDGTVNGTLPNIVVNTTDVTNANFGLQQPPVADPKAYIIDQPKVDQVITLNGSLVSTGPGTSSPGQLTGSDPEDGTLNGSGKDRTVVITTLPDNGELYYNGVLVTRGQVIPNYDPALMTIKLTGAGYTSTTFEYAYIDAGGKQSPSVPYKISWEKPLPVTLVSFTATARENTAELNWVTSEETNSDRFEIQRSTDGKAWETIGQIKAQGESKVRKTYSFTDRSPQAGDNLFRLKMVDLDGSFAYSAIRSVRLDGKLESSIYPNPVAGELNLKVTSWKQVKAIRIDNLSGLQVYSSGPVTSGKVDVSKLDSGVYILRITHTDGSVHTHKFVHIK